MFDFVPPIWPWGGVFLPKKLILILNVIHVCYYRYTNARIVFIGVQNFMLFVQESFILFIFEGFILFCGV